MADYFRDGDQVLRPHKRSVNEVRPKLAKKFGIANQKKGHGFYLILAPQLLPFNRLPTLLDLLLATLYFGEGELSRLATHFAVARICMNPNSQSLQERQFIEEVMATINRDGAELIGLSIDDISKEESQLYEALSLFCFYQKDVHEDGHDYPLLCNTRTDHTKLFGSKDSPGEDVLTAIAISDVFKVILPKFNIYWSTILRYRTLGAEVSLIGDFPAIERAKKAFYKNSSQRRMERKDEASKVKSDKLDKKDIDFKASTSTSTSTSQSRQLSGPATGTRSSQKKGKK